MTAAFIQDHCLAVQTPSLLLEVGHALAKAPKTENRDLVVSLVDKALLCFSMKRTKKAYQAAKYVCIAKKSETDPYAVCILDYFISACLFGARQYVLAKAYAIKCLSYCKEKLETERLGRARAQLNCLRLIYLVEPEELPRTMPVFDSIVARFSEHLGAFHFETLRARRMRAFACNFCLDVLRNHPETEQTRRVRETLRKTAFCGGVENLDLHRLALVAAIDFVRLEEKTKLQAWMDVDDEQRIAMSGKHLAQLTKCTKIPSLFQGLIDSQSYLYRFVNAYNNNCAIQNTELIRRLYNLGRDGKWGDVLLAFDTSDKTMLEESKDLIFLYGFACAMLVRFIPASTTPGLIIDRVNKGRVVMSKLASDLESRLEKGEEKLKREMLIQTHMWLDVLNSESLLVPSKLTKDMNTREVDSEAAKKTLSLAQTTAASIAACSVKEKKTIDVVE